MRKFGRWAKTECDKCGCEFLVTRTHSKEIEGEVICNDCEIWERSYKEGFHDGVESVAPDSGNEEVVCCLGLGHDCHLNVNDGYCVAVKCQYQVKAR